MFEEINQLSLFLHLQCWFSENRDRIELTASFGLWTYICHVPIKAVHSVCCKETLALRGATDRRTGWNTVMMNIEMHLLCSALALPACQPNAPCDTCVLLPVKRPCEKIILDATSETNVLKRRTLIACSYRSIPGRSLCCRK